MSSGHYEKNRLTPAEKMTRALNVIEKRKQCGLCLDTKGVAAALQTLATLDETRYCAHLETDHNPSHVHETHHAPRHQNLSGVGVTIDGGFVPITQPPAPDEIDERNGWHEPAPAPTAEALNIAFRQTAETLERITRWLAEGNCLEAIGLRAVAMITLLQPHAFDACAGSQTSIARHFGLTRAALQQRCSELRDIAPTFQGRNQRSPAVRDASRQRAIEQHRVAGHKLRGSTTAPQRRSPANRGARGGTI